MSAAECGCPREEEVLRALSAEGAVNSLSDDLRHHLAGCHVCADVQRLAAALRRGRAAWEAEARLPSPGQVWWRAAVRARMEAAQAATRPVTWSQGVAAAVALGIVFAVLVLTWPSLTHLVSTASLRVPGGMDATLTMLVPPMLEVLQRYAWSIAAVALVVIGGPLLALYLALAGDGGANGK